MIYNLAGPCDQTNQVGVNCIERDAMLVPMPSQQLALRLCQFTAANAATAAGAAMPRMAAAVVQR